MAITFSDLLKSPVDDIFYFDPSVVKVSAPWLPEELGTSCGVYAREDIYDHDTEDGGKGEHYAKYAVVQLNTPDGDYLSIVLYFKIDCTEGVTGPRYAEVTLHFGDTYDVFDTYNEPVACLIDTVCTSNGPKYNQAQFTAAVEKALERTGYSFKKVLPRLLANVIWDNSSENAYNLPISGWAGVEANR